VRVPTPRGVAVACAGAVLLFVASAVVAVTTSKLSIAEAIALLSLTILMAIGVVTAVVVVQTRRMLVTVVRSARTLLSEVVRRLDVLAESLEALRSSTERRAAEGASRHLELDRKVGQVASALGDLSAGVPSDLTTRLDLLRKETKETYWQIEALLELRGLLRPHAPLPPLRGYAASPDVLHHLVERVWQQKPRLVTECGSGASSIVLGYAVRMNGGGRVVALEHDPTWAEVSRAYVSMHDLDDVVEIREAPLTPFEFGGESWLWYDRAAVEDLTDIDLLFIDGPPGDASAMARYPAGPVLFPRCRQGVTIFLDDTHRREERLISARWMEEFPRLRRDNVRADKGLHVLYHDVM